jgi:hypothetical protein
MCRASMPYLLRRHFIGVDGGDKPGHDNGEYMVTTLRIAIGDYPHTLPLKRGEIKSDWLTLDFVEV